MKGSEGVCSSRMASVDGIDGLEPFDRLTAVSRSCPTMKTSSRGPGDEPHVMENIPALLLESS